MTTASKSKDAGAVSQLAALDRELAELEERQRELGTELLAKREVLEGPQFDALKPGAIGKLRALRQSDPAQFKPDGTPIGPKALELQEAIDGVGDLGPLVAEHEHATRLVEKAHRDRVAFVSANAGELLDAIAEDAGQKAAAVAAARERLHSALVEYGNYCGNIEQLLAAAGRTPRCIGADEASALRQTLEDVPPLPVPAPQDSPATTDEA
jgi:hypothetical protein